MECATLLAGNIKGDTIDAHFYSREVVYVDAVKQVEDWVAYHVFGTKDTDYAMKLINTYGTLDPADKRTRRKFNHSGVWRQMSSCTRRWLQIIFVLP